ncbi:hypothetical protein D915_000251 [Fasciola hepatica]|uniref:Uncharacterized protein n=1 Tax=Fasciola hepatica TaxID=6192 RepID=A0A4E0RMR9_FASHE|nr:hypothetical protein D915_000251 [Fasciola hepatica]
MVGRISSEYGCSFCPIASAQEEYNERFVFRVQKRDKEYCHQPFWWDSGDESSGREFENKSFSRAGKPLTHEAPAEDDVYPSAVRADVRRRERLSSGKCESNPVGSSLVYSPSDTNKARGSVRPTSNSTEQSSSNTGPPLVAPNCDNDAKWLSEYHQNYPVYPPSVYIRSASVAASRCRPFSASTTHQAASRPTQSVVPKTPVILSSRGSKTINRRPTVGEPYGVCFLHSVRDQYPSELVDVL